jgi:general stress protein 26
METPDFTVETPRFEDIAAEFGARVARMVWCSVATVDAQCRPRSRVMHPIWEGSVGWIGTWRTSVKAKHRAPSLKVRHLERNPYVSLAYVAEVNKPVYVDCRAEVIENPDERRRFCALARSLPPPYGHDPAEVFGGPDDPRFALLRLVPSRIALVEFPAPPGKVIVWRA